MDSYVKLAKEATESYLKTGKILSVPENLPSEMYKKRAGVFVSIHKRDGSLRGCIGTFSPTQENIAHEIIYNAIAAATQDPRFLPITPEELPNLEFSVDVLSKPKTIKRNFKLGDPLPKILNPQKYGLIVSAPNGQKGLLLPNIEGVHSPAEQIRICYQKGGISATQKTNLEIFETERHF